MRKVKVGELVIRLEDDRSNSGNLTYGYEWNWHRTKKNGGYKSGKDFFWVHFEIGHEDPCRVKLHVESPPRNFNVEK